ncbi:hypothetical protein [Nostoc sp. LPT]|uniref:hypothetical protein n=1 Tax=Nostoc sp. LPT TaxID=2815387 RepID=UPI001DFF033D|nr:hypothetical protein [Nostoc sp. LPT]MBN4003746.1 hypothetical protein [Nostoc sp. LPT]
MFKKLALATTLGLFAIAVASPAQAEIYRVISDEVEIDKVIPAPVQPQFVKKAMTWTSRSAAVLSNGKTYIHVGYDNQTDPYSGDTDVNEARSLLCIRKSPELAENPIPSYAYPIITPGGASKNTWSGGEVFAIPNVVGKSLLSPDYADKLCETEGIRAYKLSGFRMAEFHDGTLGWAGWTFWAQAADQFNGLSPHAIDNLSPLPNMRYWVKINDQNANSW